MYEELMFIFPPKMQSSELFLALAVQCLFISPVVCKKLPNVKAIIKKVEVGFLPPPCELSKM